MDDMQAKMDATDQKLLEREAKDGETTQRIEALEDANLMLQDGIIAAKVRRNLNTTPALTRRFACGCASSSTHIHTHNPNPNRNGKP
jgi:hypothetical protein